MSRVRRMRKRCCLEQPEILIFLTVIFTSSYGSHNEDNDKQQLGLNRDSDATFRTQITHPEKLRIIL